MPRLITIWQNLSPLTSNLYVDDLASGAQDIDSAYDFYIKLKLHLAEASFNLRKYDTNSPELRQRIAEMSSCYIKIHLQLNHNLR